jgi:hypothetical protein
MCDHRVEKLILRDAWVAEIGPIKEGGPMEGRPHRKIAGRGGRGRRAGATILATSSSSAAQDLMARSKLRVPPNARRIRCFSRSGSASRASRS